ncbi:MAG: hypothetical protein ACXWUG_18945 [Polyangiales bacterium]
MTPHYLRFAIAVVSTAAGAGAGCAGSQTEVATAPPPPSPSTSASTSTSAVPEDPPSVAQGDPTEGSGACRCSWEAKPQGIARVCRVGEHSHTGATCVRATRPKYGGVMLGPLPPPDLA